MILDETDYKIFKTLLDKEEVTTTSLARSIWDINDLKRLKKKDSFIRKRLKDWEKRGVVKTHKKDGRNVYELKEGEFFAGKGILSVFVKDNSFSIDMGDVYGVKIDGNWIVRQRVKANE